jgi:hypothetical protein
MGFLHEIHHGYTQSLSCCSEQQTQPCRCLSAASCHLPEVRDHSLTSSFTHETVHSWDHHSLMRPFSDSSFTDESLSGTQHSPLNQANMEDWCGPQAPSMRSEQMNQCLGPLFPQESLWLTSLLHLQHATQMGLRAQVDDWVFMLALPWPVNGYEKDVLSWDFPSDIVCIWFGKVNIVKKKKRESYHLLGLAYRFLTFLSFFFFPTGGEGGLLWR